MCCALCRSEKKGLCKVTGKKTDVGESATPTWKHKYEEVRWFLSHSSFTFCCAALSHCRCSWCYSYHHYALHCSPPHVHMSTSMAWPMALYGVPAWERATYLYNVNWTDTDGQLDGQSITCVPAVITVFHTSGLILASSSIFRVLDLDLHSIARWHPERHVPKGT